MCDANASGRPIVFALSNPKTQAEVTAADAYKWSGGKVLYGSGTAFPPSTLDGKTRAPGQVNNFFIFPGMSFGAVCCDASSIPESLFMAAAVAVAQSLDASEVAAERVVPHPDRIRDVSLEVAVATVLEAQRQGLANKPLGEGPGVVREALRKLMWAPAPAA